MWRNRRSGYAWRVLGVVPDFSRPSVMLALLERDGIRLVGISTTWIQTAYELVAAT